jgi:circadian clock protein KaiB
VEYASDDTQRFEDALLERQHTPYVLQLFVCGMSQRSTDAIASIAAICERYLAGRYALDVIDLYDDPHRAQTEQLLAAPTLVRQLPLPVRRAVGDLSDRVRVMRILELG